MADQSSYLTAEGAVRLKAELEQLKGPGRDELAQRLRSAIQMGDLSENADYHKAKEDQGFLEGRIRELEYVLKNAIIIDETPRPEGEVAVGARVTIREADYPEEVYLLVGSKEADPRQGRISNESPMGRALLGQKAGDKVVVQSPGGDIEFTIISVE